MPEKNIFLPFNDTERLPTRMNAANKKLMNALLTNTFGDVASARKAGANMRLRDKDGNFPLMYAVYNSIETGTLVPLDSMIYPTAYSNKDKNKNLDINDVNKSGETAMTLVIEMGDKNINMRTALRLISFGYIVRNEDIEYAREEGASSVRQVLMVAKARQDLESDTGTPGEDKPEPKT